jgi:hypothetical protein
LIHSTRKTIYILWFAIAALVLFSGRIFSEVEDYLNKSESQQQGQMLNISTHKGANVLAMYGKASLFIPMIVFAPFPTLVNIEDQSDIMMKNGNVFTHNVYAFFVVIALFVLYKKKMLRQYVLILALLLSYLAILAMSGFALSERFHVPAIPFLLIFAGYGITQLNKRNVKYYIPYLIFIAIIIIGWNLFKLKGRGAI